MIAEKHLDILHERRAKVLAGGGEDKLQERHAKGLLTARERLLALFEPDTFQEFGTHVQTRRQDFGLAGKVLAADGVITGMGYVDGRPVAVFSQDFTVAGGTLGKMHAQKIVQSMEYRHAGRACPSWRSTIRAARGFRKVSIPSPDTARCSTTTSLLSGLVPQISVIAGPCAGGAAYSPALMDFIIMIRGEANMFICGPDVIKAVTGQQCTMDDIGSADAHGSVSGNIHFIAEDRPPRHADHPGAALVSAVQQPRRPPAPPLGQDLHVAGRGHERSGSGRRQGAAGREEGHRASGRRRPLLRSPGRTGPATSSSGSPASRALWWASSPTSPW